MEAEASIFESQAAQNEQVKASWTAQISQKEEMKMREKAERPSTIVPEETGKSACQNFDGEDCAYEQRRRLQANQFRMWAQAQVLEKQAKLDAEKEADRQSAEYLRGVENACKALESKHMEEQNDKLNDMVRYNQMLAEEKRRKEREDREREQEANLAEIQGALNDPYLVEDASVSQSSMPGRVRKDHFKGMGPEAIKEMSSENRRLAEEKAESLRREMEENRAYAQNLQTVTEQLTLNHISMEEHKKSEMLKHRSILESQRTELHQKNAKGRQQAQGEMGKEFFGAFGTSNR